QGQTASRRQLYREMGTVLAGQVDGASPISVITPSLDAVGQPRPGGKSLGKHPIQSQNQGKGMSKSGKEKGVEGLAILVSNAGSKGKLQFKSGLIISLINA
ncbi:hypothetical protein, partial [Magnetococcus sp. PR-3]|uniref:hypothetical protein n=1 Tax=Magnetococcus sp. PR-3 TaxID=3120355 RepID=UPI002FCE191E